MTINGEITQSAMAAPLGGRRRRLDSVPLLGSVVGIDAGSTLTVAQGASVRVRAPLPCGHDDCAPAVRDTHGLCFARV